MVEETGAMETQTLFLCMAKVNGSVSGSIKVASPVCHLATVVFPRVSIVVFVLWFFPEALWLCCAVLCSSVVKPGPQASSLHS